MSLRGMGLDRREDGVVTGTAPIEVVGGVASIDPATDLAAGSMSAADKAKLDAIGAVVSVVTGAAPITSTGGATPAIGITPATDTAAGSLSADDKSKLDGLVQSNTHPLYQPL